VTKEYRQFCGLARAMELVGGRWTLLIVRDLLGGPKRFTDLREGLPGIPTNVLSDRLRQLEEAGIIRRAVLPRPASGVAYELTEYGAQLEQAVVTLGVWGARSMGPLREDEHVSVHALALGLRGMFVPEEAKGLDCSYEIRFEHGSLQVAVHRGALSFDEDGDPDVVIETAPDVLHGLLTGQVGLDDAVATGATRVEGDREQARRFFQMFRIGAPVAATH
jgi:DNA-binding HxlR family transcriptional regulator/putative sterol carrier protein